MSSYRHRREDHDELETDRHRDRQRSPSRTSDRHPRRRRSYSRSRSRSHDKSSNRYHTSHDKRSSRYSSRRHSVSRSRSRSQSRTYSRSHRHSRTPTKSYHSRRSHSSDRKAEHARSHAHEVGGDSAEEGRKEATTSLAHASIGGEQPNVASPSSLQDNSVEHLPLPKREAVGAYYNLDTEEPIDKEKIHREMEEKLRLALAKEGKVYPPPKPEASHPVFANDGSFIEIFKKMQQAQQVPVGMVASSACKAPEATTSAAAAYVAATAAGKPAPPPPIVGRRRGGKILKTGMVAKPKAQGEDNGDPKDFWSIYLREVNKYKNNACDTDGGTRPLVK